MKNNLIIFSILLFAPISIAQNWIQGDAQWCFEYSTQDFYGTIEAYTDGFYDTLGINHQRIQRINHQFTTDAQGASVFIGADTLKTEYVHFSNDSLFYIQNGEQRLLCDFNAQIGDKWAIHVDQSNCTSLPDTSFMVVTDTFNLPMTLTGTQFPAYELQVFNNQGQKADLGPVFLKRVGALRFLFPIENASCNNQFGGVDFFPFFDLIYFQDDSLSYYLDDCDRHYQDLGLNHPDSESFGVYPNPFSDQVTIELLSQEAVSVYNAVGQLIFRSDNVDDVALFLVDVKSGVYLVEQSGVVVRVVKE